MERKPTLRPPSGVGEPIPYLLHAKASLAMELMHLLESRVGVFAVMFEP